MKKFFDFGKDLVLSGIVLMVFIAVYPILLVVLDPDDDNFPHF